MDNFYLSAIVRELTPDVLGRRVAGVSSENSNLVIDLRLGGRRQLLASLDRTAPALYLSITAGRQTRKNPEVFGSLVHKHLVDARLATLEKKPDRAVQIGFEKRQVDERLTRSSLLLAFTGRSANAYLVDDQGKVIASLFDQPNYDEDAFASIGPGYIDAAILTADLKDTITQSEALDLFFGAKSPFGPQLKNEFLARSSLNTPADAFRSLVGELLSPNPPALLYSRFPLEQLEQRVINPKSDLMLSNIELVQAGGLLRHQFPTLSEAADKYYGIRTRATLLRARYERIKQSLSREINKRESAMARIASDRVRFQDPETLKRYGDLILANLANARKDGTTATVVDYYDTEQREIQIDIPEGLTLEQAASDYFARYRKARRALESIAARERDVLRELDPLKPLLQELEREPTPARIKRVEEATQQLLQTPFGRAGGKAKRAREKAGGGFGRWFRSSDGYEIAVGKNDRDNDALTFRIARPYDVWLHAADYPGSHVIIRNPKRDVVPYRTIAEAAALAAFNSQAKREGKATVHYTQKKFVSKPPRSKPGLVRLSSFKTILVEPGRDLKRIE